MEETFVNDNNFRISQAEDVFKVINPIYNNYPELEFYKEHLWTVCLNTRNNIICVDRTFTGSLNYCNVSPREIIKLALIKNASNLVIIHNHPSGNLEPSSEDLKITNTIKQACNIFQIVFFDHLIINKNSYLSFACEKIL